MPNPQTTWGKLDKPVPNQENLDTFLGAKLYDPIDLALFGFPEIDLAGLSGNKDLTLDEARNAVIILKNAPSGAVTVRIPPNARATIHFVNKCTGANSTVTVKTTGANSGNSAGVIIAAGTQQTVRQDGDSVYQVTDETRTVQAFTSYTPTVTPGAGAFTTVSATGRYYKVGKRVFVRIQVTITTNGTAANHVDVSLPFATPNNEHQVLAGVETQNTGKALSCIALLNTSTVRLRFYDNTYPGANGNVLVCEGVYEALL